MSERVLWLRLCVTGLTPECGEIVGLRIVDRQAHRTVFDAFFHPVREDGWKSVPAGGVNVNLANRLPLNIYVDGIERILSGATLLRGEHVARDIRFLRAAGERLEAMIAWAKRHKGSGIIYKENRKGCERLAETLRSEGIDAMAFHAEMRDADKKRVQDGFLAGHPRVICATSAFGMGVDKPDVRWVLNDGPCKSLEAYWQEAGRAGRDGKPADAVLYWSPGDWRWLRHAAWEAKSRAEESGDPSRIRAAQLMDSRLDAMSAYCETRRCLRRTILAMFDPPGTRRDDCSNCSNCQADGREIVKKPASNPYRRRRTAPETGEGQGEPMGRESIRIACRYIANIQRELGHGVRPGVLAAALHGSTRRSVTEQGLELIDGHGAFSARSRPAVRNMIGTLEAIQAIDTGTGLVEPGPLFDIYLGGDR